MIDVGLLKEDQRVSDDYDLWLRMAKCYEFDFVDEILVEYRTGTDSLSASAAHDLLNVVLAIQERFIATHFGGTYVNPAVVRRATAGKYAAHADRLLVNGEHIQAIKAYLVALRQDPRNLLRYYSLFRATLPNRLVGFVKKMVTRAQQ